jgi:hypothetical protein
MIGAPVLAMSEVFRVTTARPWTIAVAAIRASIDGSGLPALQLHLAAGVARAGHVEPALNPWCAAKDLDQGGVSPSEPGPVRHRHNDRRFDATTLRRVMTRGPLRIASSTTSLKRFFAS